ncbi:MAG: hypothetical protein R3324_11350, partial [Halobacteriales archaeon]|nr:hypothetical protein [Halobacteriales archaeon]
PPSHDDTDSTVSPRPDAGSASADQGSPPDMGSTPRDAGPDSPPPARTSLRTDWPRGLQWVRNHPMFVSGLTVQVDGVDAPFVHAYYDDFGANAIHLWETGVPHRLADWLAVPRSDHRWLTWLRADGRTWTNEQIAGGMAPGAPGRIGYQVGDEPRSWAEFEEMSAGVAAVRAHDPGALIFLNMSYLADELDRMMSEQCHDPDFDVISHDMYSIRQGVYEWLEYFRSWGLQCDKPYWRYVVSYHDLGEAGPGETDIRWHALVGLVYGYTGYSWFLYQADTAHGMGSSFFQTPGAVDSAPTSMFAVGAEVNSLLRNYGRIVTRLTSTDVRYISELGGPAQPDGTRGWEPGAGEDPFIVDIAASGTLFQEVLVGFFRDNYGERYVMLQNPNHEGGSFPVSTDDPATFTVTFDFGTAPSQLDPDRVEHFVGETGAIEDVALTPGAGGLTALEVTLAAGDVHLFKYATGAPWDMQ